MRKTYSVLTVFCLIFLSSCQSTQIQQPPQEQPVVRTEEGAVETNVGNEVCPVCGREITEENRVTYEYKGAIYNFSSTKCIEDFKRSPRVYIERVNAELKARAEAKEKQRQKEVEKQSEPVQAPHQEHVF